MTKLTSLFATACVLALLGNVSASALTVSITPSNSLQSAIDQVAAAGGGTVKLAAGTYNIYATTKLKSNVTLSGAGNPATTLVGMGNFDVLQQSAEGLSNITIKNLKITGQHNYLCHGIIVEALSVYHSNINLTNVQVRDCGMGVHLKRVNGGAATSCNFHTNGAYAGTLGFQNLYIRESTSYTVSGTNMSNCSTSSGLHLGGTCVNVSVKSNTLNSNYQYGINITDLPSGLVIDRNTCNSNNEYGIVSWGGSGSITNNTCYSNGTGGYLIYGSYTQSGNL
jgi:polygalacturonase